MQNSKNKTNVLNEHIVAHKIMELISVGGGITINDILSSPRCGYIVGTGWLEAVFDSSTPYIDVKNHVSEIFSMTKDAEGLYLGAWSHEGKVIVEVSEGFSLKSDAIQVATHRNQISIWDVLMEQEIKIKV